MKVSRPVAQKSLNPTFSQALLLIGLAASAVAYPLAESESSDPYAAPPPPPINYAPGPPKYVPAAPPKYAPKGYKEEVLPPQPYQFEYGVSDQYTGTAFKAAETQDDKGTVLGENDII